MVLQSSGRFCGSHPVEPSPHHLFGFWAGSEQQKFSISGDSGSGMVPNVVLREFYRCRDGSMGFLRFMDSSKIDKRFE